MRTVRTHDDYRGRLAFQDIEIEKTSNYHAYIWIIRGIQENLLIKQVYSESPSYTITEF